MTPILTIEDLKKVKKFVCVTNEEITYTAYVSGDDFKRTNVAELYPKTMILDQWNRWCKREVEYFNIFGEKDIKDLFLVTKSDQVHSGMSEERFDQIVDDVCEQIKNTLQVKAKEYRRNNNVFHNFDMGSQRSGLIREKVIDGFMLKHEVSIADMTNDLEKDILPTKSVLDEKFGDNIIYLIIKKASIIDKIERLVNIKTQ